MNTEAIVGATSSSSVVQLSCSPPIGERQSLEAWSSPAMVSPRLRSDGPPASSEGPHLTPGLTSHLATELSSCLWDGGRRGNCSGSSLLSDPL
ncbi:hypothetical protein SKAU_G00134980 [Synaphobranchus kaupii]|uniref:Uncharacterized protein n=1 Tax=Synaphobranchus kaupii TaxID=118154 RepID=A0A9Q1J1K8_SYNKA|nr:hypothetical protein SKAU_G00134980 [Synaphobranchus kaupii]